MRKLLTVISILIASSFLVVPAQAQAAALYDIRASWGNTNLPPGGKGQFVLQARNIGFEDGDGDLVITDELPDGVTAIKAQGELPTTGGAGFACSLLDAKTKVQCVMPDFYVSEFPKPNSGGNGFAQAPGTKTAQLVGLYPGGYLPLLFIDVAIAPSASGTGTNVATVSGGGSVAPVSDLDEVPFSSAPAGFGLVPGSLVADVFDAEYPSGDPARQAGDHPFEQRVNFDFNARHAIGADGTPYVTSNEQVNTVEVTLPRGMIGNPEATPKCDPVDFASQSGSFTSVDCPANTQVGYLNVFMSGGPTDYGKGGFLFPNEVTSHVAIYNLEPPRGKLADFGFNAGLVQGHIYGEPDAAQNYAIKTLTPNISSLVAVRGAEATFWGVPGDPAHDRFRYYPIEQPNGDYAGAPFGSSAIRPFLTNPMDCGFDNGGARIRMESYQRPGEFTPIQEYDDPLDVTGCDDPRFRFEPEVEMDPTSRDAAGPTGLDVNLKIPQRNDAVQGASELYAANGDVQGIATPPMKKVVVTLPEGMTVSPSAAPGLDACEMSEVGIDAQGRPDDAPDRCPAASQYGTIRLKSPALPQSRVVTGRLYVAEPYRNPFGSFLALYFVIDDEDLGLRVKLPGEVSLDPVTGQITTTFDDLPQLPVSESEVKVKGGLRAGLVNPQTCGTKTITATFYPWHDRDDPHIVRDSYAIVQGPGGAPCPNTLAERPFEPDFAAGTTNPLAGAFSPMEIAFSRRDTDQELASAEGTAPQGLTASLKGIGRCSEAQIAAAANPLRTGYEEIASPSCPASSQVGTIDAGAGVGQVLSWVEGRVYLAGPYRGAPASGVAIVPAAVGPFDLGVVVTRAPAYIDPVTAQLKISTDRLPQIFKGVPVRVRDVRVHLDRRGFTLNPTSCEQMRIEALLHSLQGRSKDASSRFQVGDCAALGFRPRLSLRLEGGTKRGNHPAFKATFRPRPGDANTSRIQVTLPRSAFLDQAHIRTICTRVQFAAGAGNGAECPKGSVYGRVTAWTPLLDEPLSGPVILRSSNNFLPDLVAAVSGPPSLPVRFESAARIDSVKGGIRSTFSFFPDLPLKKAVLSMLGAKKGLIVNSRDICASTNRARARLLGHNGRHSVTRPRMVATSCKRRQPRR